MYFFNLPTKSVLRNKEIADLRISSHSLRFWPRQIMKRDGFLGNFRFTQIADRPRAKKPRAENLVQNFNTTLSSSCQYERTAKHIRTSWIHRSSPFHIYPRTCLKLTDCPTMYARVQFVGHPDNTINWWQDCPGMLFAHSNLLTFWEYQTERKWALIWYSDHILTNWYRSCHRVLLDQ